MASSVLNNFSGEILGHSHSSVKGFFALRFSARQERLSLLCGRLVCFGHMAISDKFDGFRYFCKMAEIA